MARIVVFGHSDDCIEVEGDLHDEFMSHEPAQDFLHFSDGTRLKIILDEEGQWRVQVMKLGEGTTAVHTPSRELDEGERDEDGCGDYSDKVVLEGEITSVKHRRR